VFGAVATFEFTSLQGTPVTTAVCNKLRKAGFYANPKKSMFYGEKLEILGHMLHDDSLHPVPEKIRSILNWTRPKNQPELERFNAMVNYISQFLPHAATITAPLTELTGNAEWLWTDLHDAAFESIKQVFEKHQVLRPIDYIIPDMISLFTDASPTRTGALVGQGPTRGNNPTIGSYNNYHLSPNGIPRGSQRWYGLVYLVYKNAGSPKGKA